MKNKKGSIFPGIFVLILGLYVLLSSLGIDIVKYIFFPGWIGVLVAAIGIIDIVKFKLYTRGIIFIFTGAAIALFLIGIIGIDFTVGLCITFIGIVILAKTLISRYGSQDKGSK